MSRLDQHVARVQNKLALRRLVQALAWTTLVFAAVVWIMIWVDRLFGFRPPQPMVWFWSGLGASVALAIVYAIIRRPSRRAAAVAIDDELRLKEKFSTALYIRSSRDPFAQAAVRDAERTAQDVNLRKRFGLSWPRPAYGTLVVALLAFLTIMFVKPMDLFGRQEAQRQQVEQMQRAEVAKKTVERALATVNSIPKTAANEEAIRNAKIELQHVLNEPIKDPGHANRTALKAMQDVQKAIDEQIRKNRAYVEAKNDARLYRSLTPPANEQGNIPDAQRALAQGNFSEAVNELQQAVSKFDQMDEEQKKKTAEQMQRMAQQLQQMANDPQLQEKLQKQLQQLGANQQQAQQMAQAMQQAAQGNPQAQQQLQQMAQQMMQQMNNGQGPTQQQQQQIQQMMQQMQAQANNQAQAQQMAQAAQQMAQAMAQAAQQQPGQQQNGQQGQQGQQMAGQQMQQGMQAMQEQLEQLEAMALDAQAMEAAQQAAQEAMEMAAANCEGGGDGDGEGADEVRWKDRGGQWAAGDINRKGAGQGGAGIGAGGRGEVEQAPFGVKKEFSPSQENATGRILASTLIKGESLRGEAREELKELAESAQREATEEVDQQRISRQAQSVVKRYFETMQNAE